MIFSCSIMKMFIFLYFSLVQYMSMLKGLKSWFKRWSLTVSFNESSMEWNGTSASFSSTSVHLVTLPYLTHDLSASCPSSQSVTFFKCSYHDDKEVHLKVFINHPPAFSPTCWFSVYNLQANCCWIIRVKLWLHSPINTWKPVPHTRSVWWGIRSELYTLPAGWEMKWKYNPIRISSFQGG